MAANRTGEMSMLARFRLYKLEVLNNVGYILASLAVSQGLPSYSFFQELVVPIPLFQSILCDVSLTRAPHTVKE